MRIGIDGGCYSNRRGFGRVLREQFAALLRIDTDNDYVLFLDTPADVPPHPKLTVRMVGTMQTVAAAATSDSRRSLADLFKMGRAVAQEPLDLFFFPAVYSWFPLHNRVPNLVGIHDTIADRNPQFAFASKSAKLFWRLKVKGALWQADGIVTVSEYSSRCIQEFFQEAPSKIHVVPNAVSDFFHPVETAPTAPYVLYAGGISPNKNLPLLIDAFYRCHKARPEYRLVLAGDYAGDGFMGCYEELRAQIARLGIGSIVQFTGFISDERLRELYSGAAVFAMPSIDEGFGLPALEAMACGAPVVVSKGNALEEVVGSAGIVCDNENVAEWAHALTTASSAMRGRSLARASEFSWEHSARCLLRAFQSL